MRLSDMISPDIEAALWVIEEVKKLESELAALRQQQTFAWNALDSAMIKDHDRTGSLAESITRLAMERYDLRQQHGEPVAWRYKMKPPAE